MIPAFRLEDICFNDSSWNQYINTYEIKVKVKKLQKFVINKRSWKFIFVTKPNKKSEMEAIKNRKAKMEVGGKEYIKNFEVKKVVPQIMLETIARVIACTKFIFSPKNF